MPHWNAPFHELHVKKRRETGWVNFVQTLDLSQNRNSTLSVSYWLSVYKYRKYVLSFYYAALLVYFSIYVFLCNTFLAFVFGTFLPFSCHTKFAFVYSTICQYSTYNGVLYILCIHVQHLHLQSCSRVQYLGYIRTQNLLCILIQYSVNPVWFLGLEQSHGNPFLSSWFHLTTAQEILFETY